MRTLPLFLEGDGFRAVHACWHEEKISQLRQLAPNGILSTEQFIMAADPAEALHDLVEVATKGPEAVLPEGYTFSDKNGHVRKQVRVQWWKPGARSWAEIAISVPHPEALPKTALPADIAASIYPAKAKSVFFGHYWLYGAPSLQAPNALCLDYSAGTTGPLVTYQLVAGQSLSLDRIVVHDL
jgi:hypothetical protein